MRADKGVGKNNREVMLDTDMCLAYRTNRELSYCKKYFHDEQVCDQMYGDGRGQELIAANGNCCAWTKDVILFGYGVLEPGEANQKRCGRKVSGLRPEDKQR